MLLPSRYSTRYFMSSASNEGYSRQDEQAVKVAGKQPLYPKAGDIVRYYDMDGGRADGEVLVGKISFLQRQLSSGGAPDKWLVELTELENVGDGYYAEYPSRQRSKRKAMRPLEEIAPIAASFVRGENAFKVPRTAGGDPSVRADQYDIEGYLGPFTGENAINKDVLIQDGEVYSALKFKLIRNAAIAGVVGTLIADLVKGTQDALIYAVGAAAGVAYVYFLSVKTDTVGSENAKLGSNVSNIRFVLPVLVVTGVALYNKSLGDANPMAGSTNPFETITPEQFGAAILGLLTYRIPLFLGQIQDFLGSGSEEELTLPGSVGVAMKMAQEGASTGSVQTLSDTDALTPILVVSGPQATGRSSLVKQLVAEGDGRFVEPKRVEALSDGATFERLMNRGDFLEMDPNESWGVTREGIMTAAKRGESVVVVDADVDLAKKLATISGARLIGVWVGLDSVDKFESRLQTQIESGEIEIPPDETEESVIRAKVREIVKDIEFGIVSGMFEFTILNDNPEESIKELKTAAAYCFK